MSRCRSSISRLALAAAAFLSAPAARAAETPRLVVVVSVDQLRAEAFESAGGGFKTIRDGGAVLAQARHDHIPTETGPGHAAILTGRYPGRHGIIGNEWWDRARGRSVYVVEDSVHGLGPENLLVYALGDILKAKDPEAKVVSLSLKDRAAILMGGKRPDLAVWYDRKKGEFATSSYYRRPRWLDGVNARLAGKGGPLAGASQEAAYDFVYRPEADRALLDLVREALAREGLGRDGHPDILAVSFSATDYVGHKFGPDSPEMKAQLESLGGLLSELLAELERRVGAGRFDLVLTSDHGVAPLVESPAGQALGARRVLYETFHDSIEKALQDWTPAPKPWVVGRNYPNLYLDRDQAERLGHDWHRFLKGASKALEKVPEVANAQPADAIEADDPYRDCYARSALPGRSGDLLVRVQQGVVVTDRPKGTDHGTPYDFDARVPLVFYGPAFKPGRHQEPARVVDLAPTLALVLGLGFAPEPGSRAWAELLAP